MENKVNFPAKNIFSKEDFVYFSFTSAILFGLTAASLFKKKSPLKNKIGNFLNLLTVLTKCLEIFFKYYSRQTEVLTLIDKKYNLETIFIFSTIQKVFSILYTTNLIFLTGFLHDEFKKNMKKI